MNVPKLRFKEFDGEWEYHQFSEIVNRVSKSSNSNILPKVEFEDIVAGEGRLKKNVANKFDDRKGTLFQPNNILYGKLRPYLKNWLFPKFQGVALGDFWVFEAVNIAPAFLYALIQSENYQRVANDTAGTKMPRSDWKKVSTTKFAIPMNIKEQEKIGVFFEILDKKIQLQQQKIDLLQEQKKGFLQKMFPKAGEKQPQVRFAGFTDDWEQRKFGEIITERREKTKIENEDTLLSSAIDGMYLNSELFSHFRGKSNIGYLKIRKNDMILSAQNLHLGNCNINQRFEHGIISPAYKVYSLVNVDAAFMHAWIKKDSTKQFFENATTEGASVCRKNIEWGTLYSQKIYIPIYSEQQKIGELFNVLDRRIQLQQQKLELLQKQKKGFMQKMFI